jgi:integrase
MARTLQSNKGAGTITELQRGKRYRLRFVGATGQRSVTFEGSAGEARAELARLVAEARRFRGLAPEVAISETENAERTVEDLLEAWITARAGSYKPATLASYRLSIDNAFVPAIGPVRLVDLGAKDLDDLYARWLAGDDDHMPLAATTIRNRHACLQTALRQAEKWGWINKSAARDVTLPPVDRPRVDAISTEDVSRLVTAAQTEEPALYLFTVLAVATGARRGELCGLRWSRVDLDAGKVLFDSQRTPVDVKAGTLGTPKTLAGRRTIDLDPSVVDLLTDKRREQVDKAAKAGVDLVADPFVLSYQADGRAAYPNALGVAFSRLATKVGLPKGTHPHQLRHSAATILLADGIDVGTVSKMLGHSHGGITHRLYVHGTEANMTEAAGILGKLATARPALNAGTEDVPALTP